MWMAREIPVLVSILCTVPFTVVYQTEFVISFLYFVGKDSHMLSSVVYLYFLPTSEPVDGLPCFYLCLSLQDLSLFWQYR